MIETKSAPKPGEGIWLWLIKIISGVLIIFILLTHFIINHYQGTAGGGLLTYEEVIQMLSTPAYLVLEMVFLLTVIPHALIGLRSVILDLSPSKKVMTVVDWLLVIVGVGAVVYGIWLASAISAQAG